MTAIALTPEQQAAALVVAREVAAAVIKARTTVGHTRVGLATELGMFETTLRTIEGGAEPNLKLGSVVRVLDHFGLTLVVMPRDTGAREQRISAVIDRVLALKGGEDLLKHHLQRRGFVVARGD